MHSSTYYKANGVRGRVLQLLQKFKAEEDARASTSGGVDYTFSRRESGLYSLLEEKEKYEV